MPRPLPEDHVRLILRYHTAGYRVSSIAKALGIHRNTVSRVVTGRTHVRIKDDPKLPQLRRVKLNRTPLNPDGRTDVERELLRREKMERENEELMAAHQKRRDNDTGAVDGQAREAQEPPALTDGGGSMHQDQGAQVDDVPVVDDAVDESDDAPAEAPPIEGREVDAPADALAEPLEPRPKPPRYRDTALRGLGSGVDEKGFELLRRSAGKLRSPTER